MTTWTPEAKAKLSASQQARHRAAREAAVSGPTHKRCSGPCGRMLPIDGNFNVNTRTLRNGDKVRYPSGKCRDCTNAEKRVKLATMSPTEREQRRLQQAGWNAKRNGDAARAYHREYGRARRKREGATERGPWRKYRTNGSAHRCDVDYLTLPLLSGLEEQARTTSHPPQ